MARASPLLSSFNAGELSPLVAARVDVGKIQNGCRYLENFKPLIQGPAVRRAGSRFVAEVKNSANRTWLVKFEFNVQQSYALEFGDHYIRFYTNHGQLLATGAAAYAGGTTYGLDAFVTYAGLTYRSKSAGNTGHQPDVSPTWWERQDAYQITSPYSAADLTADDGTFNLRFVESNDVVYLCHQSYAPRKLSRLGATNWTLTVMTPTNGPFQPINDTATTVYPSARTGTVTLASSAAIFSAAMVGSLFYYERDAHIQITTWEAGKAVSANDLRRSDNIVYRAVNAGTTGNNKPIHTEGSVSDGAVTWEYQDAGFGYGIISAYTSSTSVSLQVVKALPDNGSSATSYTNTRNIESVTNSAGLYKVKATAHGFSTGNTAVIANVVKDLLGTPHGSNGTWVITVIDADNFTLDASTYDADAWLGTGTASVTTVTASAIVGTTRWALAAWSDVAGWPSQVCFFKERLTFGGGQQVWMSVAGDYENFAKKDASGLVVADMAISITLQSDQVNDIQWMAPGDTLLVGTAGNEFSIQPLTMNEVFGPGNVTAPQVSAFGSRSIPPVRVGDEYLFVQRSGLKLRDVVYDTIQLKFLSKDKTVLSEHITRGGLTQIAFQQEPHSIIWAVRADGRLIGFTFNKEQDVEGWHPHRLGGAGIVECVLTMPAPDGDRDELWMIVRRTINGAPRRYIEFLEAEHQVGDDPEDAFYVDAGLTLDNTINATLKPGAFATLQHHENVEFIAGSAVFVSGDVGRSIHYRYSYEGIDEGGAPATRWATAKAIITTYNSATSVSCTIAAAFPSESMIAANGWRMTVSTISGLDHLEGETVAILADGATHPARTVSSGAITLQAPASIAHIGLACPAKLQTMRLNAGAQDGTSQGKTARINKAVVRLLESLGLKYGQSFAALDEIPFRSSGDLMDSPPDLFTGDIVLDWPGDYDSNPWLAFQQDDPLPCTIVGIMPTVSINDRG